MRSNIPRSRIQPASYRNRIPYYSVANDKNLFSGISWEIEDPIRLAVHPVELGGNGESFDQFKYDLDKVYLMPKVKVCNIKVLDNSIHTIDSPDNDYLTYYQLLKGIEEIIHQNLTYLIDEYGVSMFVGVKQINDDTYIVLFE